MSVPGGRPDAEQSSVNVVRGLLERNLLERAVALAETRWPGSGPLVRLAHEWSSLSPGDRRQRLAAIGPEELARMRALANIQPELARVLDDLEARGILPPVIDQRVATQPTPQPTAADAPPREDTTKPAAPDPVDAAPPARPARPSARAAPEQVRRPERQRMTPLPQASRPTLDLGLPTTTEFLESEVERRAQMVEQAESILARVRARIDESSDRLVERRPVAREDRPAPLSFDRVERRSSPAQAVETDTIASEPARDRTVAGPTGPPAAVTAPAHQEPLAARLRFCQVLEIDEYEPAPSHDEILAAARDLDLAVVELSTSELNAREFWGGLVREGRNVAPRAGRFPIALSGHNLVIVHGRLTPRAVSRLRDGFCDIPGTKSTVKISDRTRILLLPA